MTLSTPNNTTQKPNINIVIAGEDSIIIYIDSKPNKKTSEQLAALDRQLRSHCSTGIIDTIPSYTSLWIQYHFDAISHEQLQQLIYDLWHSSEIISAEEKSLFQPLGKTQSYSTDTANQAQSNTIVLPVYYGPECSLDIARIEKNSDLSHKEIISLHTAADYSVYAIGFAPGFGYLGEVDKRIATPRLSTPRKSVPKGAVAIADQQTAIYPAASPGGWNIIGNCPLDMFDPTRTPASPFNVGDTVNFKSIDRDEFIALGGKLP